VTDPASPIETHRDIDGVITAAVERALDGQDEIGLQVAAYRGGQLIVDVAGGVADQASGAPVTAESLFPVFSVTKGVVAALALRLLGEGAIALDTRIAELWPEFAAEGKGTATVEEALTHSVGIPQMPSGVTPELMCDWDRMCALVAALPPVWTPGEKVGYHSYTFGWIVGETLRRALVTDASVGELARDLIAGPSGASDFWIGTPADQHHRIVTLYKEPRPAGTGRTLAERAIPPQLPTGQDVFGRRDVRESCHPAAGGIATARSLAAIFGMLASGGAVEGTQLISEHWIDEAAGARRDEVDLVIGERLAKGLGGYVSADTNDDQGPPFEAGQRTLGHPGSGGSIAWADRALGTGFAITRSRMTTAGWNDPIVRSLVGAVRDAVSSVVVTSRG
jgi:CubicO group peptidase (beta-lactamase class C family)